MAFTNALDPLTPINTEAISNGDDRIRELKAALIERLAQVITGFPDTDPLSLVQTKMFTAQEFLASASGAQQTVVSGSGIGVNGAYSIFAQLKDQEADKCVQGVFVWSSSGSVVPQFYLLNKVQGAGATVDLVIVGSSVKVVQTSGTAKDIRVTSRRIS